MDFEVKDYPTMQAAIAAFCRFLNDCQVPSERVFDSKLVASELLGNVLKHSDGVARLRGEIRNGFIELVVLSSEAFCPPQKSDCSEVYAEHGRGLFLVDYVCEERITTEEGGICVKIKIR